MADTDCPLCPTCQRETHERVYGWACWHCGTYIQKPRRGERDVVHSGPDRERDPDSGAARRAKP